MATQRQIDGFHEFATRQLRAGHGDLSLAEMFDLWETENQSDDELADSVAALRSALSDMEQGDTGRPVEQFMEEMRNQYGISSSE